ncbi:hypothetical protein ATK17_3910 [Branchiibius hedensis]|uniref:Uncharacterized protein n=2 Tax=Branchiibius hedensis TaxID=672460 RepID=A0A2Y9C6Z1_9MICO|nr:hypothetical protein ATK17_3910 [Branchiibius hedensis]SSA59095.1 hypothetical protein SAMN04489750_3910 [Branchiibius hedensis]
MLVRWMITGLRHGSSKSSGARKMLLVVLARVLVVAFWPMAGLFAYRMGCARSRWVYYASPKRDAVLGVHRTRRGWFVGDHMTPSLRSGTGKALRDVVIPELTVVVDEAEVTVRTVATSERQAADYLAEIPGLVDDGPALLGGRRLRRPPQPPR